MAYDTSPPAAVSLSASAPSTVAPRPATLSADAAETSRPAPANLAASSADTVAPRPATLTASAADTVAPRPATLTADQSETSKPAPAALSASAADTMAPRPTTLSGEQSETSPPAPTTVEDAVTSDPTMKTGNTNLVADQEGGTVTGLTNTFAITFVQVSVVKPAGGDNIEAHAVAGSFTATGFAFTLTAPIPSGAADGDYKLFFAYK